MIVYKITNTVNNKIYIGITTCSLEYRWSKHLAEGRRLQNSKPLYRAIRKYGPEKFRIEPIATTDDLKELGRLEHKYIKQYNSTNPAIGYNLTPGGESNQWDANPSAQLTYDDVVKIRQVYANGKLRCHDCWQLYKDKISFDGFQKIWCRYTWQGILGEVYTPDNIEKHRHQTMHFGSDNYNARLDEQQVLQIRQYYVNHTLQETYEAFGIDNGYSKDSFREVLTRTFSNIPIYRKQKKCWTLHNKIIDINTYNPVSTIHESVE